MSKRIVILPGDGIGLEVVNETTRMLNVMGSFEVDPRLIGGASIDRHGVSLTDETLQACANADAVLLGSVGGPKWESDDPEAPRPEQGLLGLRKGMGLYANLRPIKVHPALQDASPLKPERIAGTNFLFVRELNGGIYYGDHTRSEDGDTATDTCTYSRAEVQRVARVAFKLATTKVTSLDKANVLETSRLWRETVTEVAQDYDVELEHLLVDNANFQIPMRPTEFDVILAENLSGDILSDGAAIIPGSLGMLPSASLGDEGKPGLFEPAHGSAPDIAGLGIANPLATIKSGALMLRYGLGMEEEATAVEAAVDKALDSGLRTRDLGGTHSTREATDAVLKHL